MVRCGRSDLTGAGAILTGEEVFILTWAGEVITAVTPLVDGEASTVITMVTATIMPNVLPVLAGERGRAAS